jgi:Protein of unknown function (DUF1214)
MFVTAAPQAWEGTMADADMHDEATRRVLDGRSWADFCDALKAAGAIVLDPANPADPRNRAEGFRYLGRLARAALETFIEDADPLAPELLRTCHATIKMGADNPDNLYQNAPISGKHEYVIRGRRGTVHYLGFATQESNYGATGSLPTTGYLDDRELRVEPDGRFEIAVSRERRPGNWLPMSEQTRALVVRQTFLDRATEEPASLSIERLGGRHAPRPLSAPALDRGLAASGKFVAGCAHLFQKWAIGFRDRPNQLPRFDAEAATAAGGVPHIAYYHGYWQIAPDEALVIEVTPPDCDYWNFQLNNFWMESLDYRYFPISINKKAARLEPDGSVRVVVAHRDPGGGRNWIDTCGHTLGTMCWRWVRAADHPEPRTRVVPLAEVA